MKTLPLSEVKMKLSELVDAVQSRDEEITITRNGKPVAVLVSSDQFQSWQETLLIRSDRDLMAEIRQGIQRLKKNRRLYTLDELFEK
ncbi:MAG TPA: type II toxin-antitoxin system Phd/YefM family antitoxin [Syntrophaceae bacterium]|nr:type II toxin-antitoxin system Phd/YefM family antitoxin [Syntrophaceae bacterium]